MNQLLFHFTRSRTFFFTPDFPPDCVLRNYGLILLLDNSMQSIDRPQIGFVSLRDGWFKDDFYQFLRCEVFQQPGTTTPHFSQQS